MTHRLLNNMRQQALGVLNTIDCVRIGTVQSYNPNTYSCTVLLQPEEIITGWLPIISPWAGNGWGVFCPPVAGAAVAIIPREGALDAAMLLPAFFNDVERPLPCPQGEFWLVHKSGSCLKFLNNGDVEIVTQRDLMATVGRNLDVTVAGNATLEASGNLDATITGNATITAQKVTADAPLTKCTGNLDVTGSLTVGLTISATGSITSAANVSDATSTMQADRVIYNGHTHNDPQGGVTGPPNQTE